MDSNCVCVLKTVCSVELLGIGWFRLLWRPNFRQKIPDEHTLSAHIDPEERQIRSRSRLLRLSKPCDILSGKLFSSVCSAREYQTLEFSKRGLFTKLMRADPLPKCELCLLFHNVPVELFIRWCGTRSSAGLQCFPSS